MSVSVRVFLSHSVSEKDRPLLQRLESEWRESGIEVYLAEREFAPTGPTEKVRGAMTRSDVVVVLLTESGSSSSWVAVEIGLAIEQSKPIIPLVEEGVDPPGPIRERDQIRFNRQRPEEAIGRATRFIESFRPTTTEPDVDPFIAGVIVGAVITAFIVLLIVALARK